LLNEQKAPGNYKVEFNGSTGGSQSGSGIYFYQLQAGRGFTMTGKLLLLK
jgi:hypothetical protein